MKFRSPKPKPETGMEMILTCCMPVGQTVEQSAAAMLAFIELLQSATEKTGAIWFKMRCENIPEELEPKLQAALDKYERKPSLSLVVDNTNEN